MNNRSILALVTLLASSPIVWAETRNVENFDNVTYSLPFDIEFVESDESFVRLEGDQDTIDEINTKVHGQTLKIRKDNSWFDWSDGEVHITVGYQSLEQIKMAGSGNGYAKSIEADQFDIVIAGSSALEVDTLACNDLAIAIAGAGDVNVNELEADSMSTKIAGSGNIDVSGRVVSQKITISGSGDHNASDLRSQEAKVTVQGSGDVEVWAIATLDVTVMGSGNIGYFGDPSVEQRIMGSGDIEHLGDAP